MDPWKGSGTSRIGCACFHGAVPTVEAWGTTPLVRRARVGLRGPLPSVWSFIQYSVILTSGREKNSKTNL